MIVVDTMEEKSGVAILHTEKSFINATTNSILSKKKVLQPTFNQRRDYCKMLWCLWPNNDS